MRIVDIAQIAQRTNTEEEMLINNIFSQKENTDSKDNGADVNLMRYS